MTLRALSYSVVDVFTKAPLEGNPLAVFKDGRGLEDQTMQRIARELNLPETVFALSPVRPDCAARLRIFTPALEMAFAGHPTVGAAFVLLRSGIVPKTAHFTLELPVGGVAIRLEGDPDPLVWLKTPPIAEGRTFERSLVASVLGLSEADLLGPSPQLLSAGNPTVFVPLRSEEAVDRCWLDAQGWKAVKGGMEEAGCLYVFAPRPQGAYSRMFAPEYGIPEDPATGSSAGPLALFMARHGLASAGSGTRLTIEQGAKMGRRSILHVLMSGAFGQDGIEVGGHVTPIIEATMSL